MTEKDMVLKNLREKMDAALHRGDTASWIALSKAVREAEAGRPPRSGRNGSARR